MRSRNPVNASYSAHSSTKKRPIALILSSLAFVAGAGTSAAAPVAENWGNHCAKSHGADGKGQTKAGKEKMKPLPDPIPLKIQSPISNSVRAQNKPAAAIYYRVGGNWIKAVSCNPTSNNDLIGATSGLVIRKYETPAVTTAEWLNTWQN